MHDQTGAVRSRTSRELSANYFSQMAANDFAGTTLQSGDTLFIAVRSGAVIAYGAAVDNTTNDPAFEFVRKVH